MTRIYLVRSSGYEDPRIFGAFTDRAEAERISDLVPSYVDSIELDGLVGYKGCPVHVALVKTADGSMQVIKNYTATFSPVKDYEVSFTNGGGTIRVDSSQSPEHAAEIAFVKYQDYARCRAQGVFPEWES